MSGQDRVSVYWGVDPYPKGQESFKVPYPGWQQAQARDWSPKDETTLLAAAREWLRNPILKDASEGLLPDIRFRAALDLAISNTEDGKYSMGVHPDIYNQLLARLAGVSGEGTLLTIRQASRGSVYHPQQERITTMRSSALIRQYAKKFATTNPTVSFDLLELASRVADDEQTQDQQAQQQKQGQDQGQQDQGQQQKQGQDQQTQDQQTQEQKQAGEMPPALKKHLEEQKGKGGDDQGQGQQGQDQKQAYTTLKQACLTAARTNPEAKAALLPVLRTIKSLG